MGKYFITLEVTTDSNPDEWVFEEPLIIDDKYKVIDIKETE